ncbi:MAG: EamA family transporter [Clostridia bacterium]|nr:EamA family transporter [Clostridia bacterium]
MNDLQKKPSIFQNPLVVIFGALLCCALWGSATPFIKTGYELLLPERDVPSTILFAGIRFTLAGVLTVLIYSVARRRVLYPKRENLPRVLIIAAFQTVIQYIFFYVGLANTSGVKGTILSGSSAFFSVLIASLIFRQEKLTPKKIIACLLGLAGIIIVNLQGLEFTMNFFGDAFVLFSTISLAFSSVLIKRFSKREDPVVLSGYQFIIGGIFMVLVGIIFGGRIALTSAVGILVLVYLAFLSAIAYALWGMLLKFNPVSRVTIFSFTTPIFGTLLSMLMLRESSGVEPLNLVLTLLLVSAGIFLLNYQPKSSLK